MVDKIKWCRENAPRALQSLSDAELVEYMGSAYDAYVESSEDKEVLEYQGLDKIYYLLATKLNSYLAFKGGYILSQVLPVGVARRTADVDASIGKEEIYEKVKEVLLNIALELEADGLVDNYTVKDTVSERMSGGIDMYKEERKVFGVDIGYHDISWGVVRSTVNGVDISRFSVERMLSDKASSVLSRKRFRRTKDIYDFYVLTNYFDVDVSVLKEFLISRCETINTWPFSEEILVQYEIAYEKLILVTKDGEPIPKPTFNEVLNTFYLFMKEMFENGGNVLWSSKDKAFTVKREHT